MSTAHLPPRTYRLRDGRPVQRFGDDPDRIGEDAFAAIYARASPSRLLLPPESPCEFNEYAIDGCLPIAVVGGDADGGEVFC